MHLMLTSTFDTGLQSSFLEDFQTQRTHVIDVIRRNAANITSFLCVEAKALLVNSQATSGSWASELGVAAVVRENHPDQISRCSACFQVITQYETRTGTRFTHVIRSRPDLRWFADLPNWGRLSRTTAVIVRARLLTSMPPRKVSEHALAFWANRSCGAMASWAHENTAQNMQRHRIKECLLADDQWAIFPRALAQMVYGDRNGNARLDNADSTHLTTFRTQFGSLPVREYESACGFPSWHKGRAEQSSPSQGRF